MDGLPSTDVLERSLIMNPCLLHLSTTPEILLGLCGASRNNSAKIIHAKSHAAAANLFKGGSGS
ncbi:uncharacterized protein LAESUDRAFT_725256 [Laetiporus sulphureus 93-53]|uniref:Uncharacterized protein n=1 Tax=Laetiporus sulphureus 93-53 TaxID=1314785 RepID=A0A165EM20_9APHY|nr:uncharacterized protein LAESUDRAFT_725256 [Laetiporus sulphureus 93-53]KZT07341.1 hypothetical protein LAESUDRAFT_725256 [Laetiporus sulphureus 93-53]